MKGSEIVSTLKQQARADHLFVKWWRKEEDFLDYDLIDRFLEQATKDEEIGGLQLLTMNEMRDEVKRVGGTRVKFIHEPSGDTRRDLRRDSAAAKIAEATGLEWPS